jgi:hypothetical protein
LSDIKNEELIIENSRREIRPSGLKNAEINNSSIYKSLNPAMKPQISHSYPFIVWLLTAFMSPYIAMILVYYMSGFDLNHLSFELFFISAFYGTVISIPAFALLYALYAYLAPDVQNVQTLRVTTLLFGVCLFLLTWLAFGWFLQELIDLEFTCLFLAYLGVIVVAGLLVYIEGVEEGSTPYV